MTDELTAARALLPGARLRGADTLRSGDRCTVRRVQARLPDRDTDTVIVKHFHRADEHWIRETAALSVLPAGVGPELIAAGAEPPALAVSDLGATGSLADTLLGDDPARAADDVCRWAAALARLHVATSDVRAAFAAALDRRAGEVPGNQGVGNQGVGNQGVGNQGVGNQVADNQVTVELEDAVRMLDQHCGALGVVVPAGAFDELRGLGRRLGADSIAALSPADACPDNNVRVGDRFELVDFEGAQFRHVAWDLAYLSVPWPTCWCAWRLPPDVRDRALAAYRDLAAVRWPQIAGDAFTRDVRAATVGWAMTSSTWFLAGALEAGAGDPDGAVSDPQRPAPPRRAMIRHRLGVARRSDELPALSELAANLDDAVAARWGDVPLDHAPAFR